LAWILRVFCRYRDEETQLSEQEKKEIEEAEKDPCLPADVKVFLKRSKWVDEEIGKNRKEVFKTGLGILFILIIVAIFATLLLDHFL